MSGLINCWVGVSCTDHEQWKAGVKGLREVEASVKFFSFEPLLHRIGAKFYDFDDDISWGNHRTADTHRGRKTQPRIEWIGEIVEAADKAGIPVFLKDNLKPLLIDDKGYAHASVRLLDRDIESGTWKLRQEMPR